MSTTTTIKVNGMTCGHCVKAVTAELSELAGVDGVDVDLTPGAASTVTITSSGSLPAEQIAAAIDEAGYELAGPPTSVAAAPDLISLVAADAQSAGGCGCGGCGCK
ncbi:heavy-metal-associated domain-containing protein [Rarobacter incanus]|uniref:Copper chaperone CopZ n=1 Tax=Rarobacter incanus TaxID=153494 RepID=A0A542SQ48_9MICO|nr:copper chaperone CopZ [Rarobacter incanus]